MSTIRATTGEAVYKIERFLGLNENPDGDTKLKLGEASQCRNWKVTRDLNLQRRPGTKTLYTFSESPVMGLWYGKVNGKDTGLAASGGHMWKWYEDDYLEEPYDLGKIDTTNRVNFFAYSGIVYILNGVDYYEYDGTRFGPVIGYRPLVVMSRTPDGSSSNLLEEVNKLNGIRRVWFSPDGKTGTFTLPETDLVSIDYVKLNADGSYINPKTYTRDRLHGIVEFIGNEELTGDGTTAKFALGNERVATAVATIEGTEVTVKLNQDDNTLTFIDPPAEGAVILVTESTTKEEKFYGDGVKESFNLTNAGITGVTVTVDGEAASPVFDDNKIVFGASEIDDTETHKGDGTKKDFYLWKENVTSVTATVNGTATECEFDETEKRCTFTTAPANNSKILFTERRLTTNAPGIKEETFNGDDSKKTFQLTTDNIAYVSVTSTKTETPTHSASADTITFSTAPVAGAEIIVTETQPNDAEDKTEYFHGDGSTKVFYLANTDTTAVTVKVKTNISPTFDKSKLQITFSEAPKTGELLTVKELCSVEIVVTETIEETETFTGDGETAEYRVMYPTYTITSTVDGVAVEQSYDEETGTITYTKAPANEAVISLAETLAPERGTNTIEIGYTAAGTYRNDVAKMTNAELFLGSQDNAVFLYGNGTNEAIYSGIDYDGKPRADYFPDLNEMAVADKNTPITSMVRHYSQMICFKSNSVYSVHFGTITTALGQTEYGFYVTPINRSVGNEALGQVQIVNNSPYVLHGKNLYEWRNTSSYSSNLTIDERQAKTISNRIFSTLGSFDFSKCYCFDDNNEHEYYICFEDKQLVYNYDADAWYVYTGWHVNTMCNTDDKLLYGSDDGKIYEISEDYLNDDGVAIDSFWESGSIDFGKNYMRKLMTELWVSFKPEERSYVLVTVQTNKKSEYTEKEITHYLSTFDHMNFASFSFKVNRKPQVKKLKIKAKKFAFLKLIFRSKDLYTTATILSADPKIRETGYMK